MIDQQKYFNEKYVHFDEDKMQWIINDGVSDEIRKELEEFLNTVNPKPDDDGIITMV